MMKTSTRKARRNEFEISLRDFDAFADVSEKTSKFLLEEATYRILDLDEELVALGQELPGLIIGVHGELKVYRINPACKEQIFQMAGPGSVVGYQGVFGDSKAAVRVRSNRRPNQ